MPAGLWAAYVDFTTVGRTEKATAMLVKVESAISNILSVAETCGYPNMTRAWQQILADVRHHAAGQTSASYKLLAP